MIRSAIAFATPIGIVLCGALPLAAQEWPDLHPRAALEDHMKLELRPAERGRNSTLYLAYAMRSGHGVQELLGKQPAKRYMQLVIECGRRGWIAPLGTSELHVMALEDLLPRWKAQGSKVGYYVKELRALPLDHQMRRYLELARYRPPVESLYGGYRLATGWILSDEEQFRVVRGADLWEAVLSLIEQGKLGTPTVLFLRGQLPVRYYTRVRDRVRRLMSGLGLPWPDRLYSMSKREKEEYKEHEQLLHTALVLLGSMRDPRMPGDVIELVEAVPNKRDRENRIHGPLVRGGLLALARQGALKTRNPHGRRLVELWLGTKRDVAGHDWEEMSRMTDSRSFGLFRKQLEVVRTGIYGRRWVEMNDWPQQENVDFVADLTRTEEREVIQALGRITPPSELPFLLDGLRAAKEPKLRSAWLWAIGLAVEADEQTARAAVPFLRGLALRDWKSFLGTGACFETRREALADLALELAVDRRVLEYLRDRLQMHIRLRVARMFRDPYAHTPEYPAQFEPKRMFRWIRQELLRPKRVLPLYDIFFMLRSLMCSSGLTEAAELVIDHVDDPDKEVSAWSRKLLLELAEKDLGRDKQAWKAWAAARLLPAVRAAAHKAKGCLCPLDLHQQQK